MHVAPFMPHWVSVCAARATQVCPAQLPVLQEAGVQVHVPFWQICPVGQPHTPKVQQPPFGQAAGCTQVPFGAQQSPTASQGGQMPLAGLHVLQPGQVATHMPLSQQPWLHFGTQCPFSQQWPLGRQVALGPVPHFGAAGPQGTHWPCWQTSVLPQQAVGRPLLSAHGV